MDNIINTITANYTALTDNQIIAIVVGAWILILYIKHARALSRILFEIAFMGQTKTDKKNPSARYFPDTFSVHETVNSLAVNTREIAKLAGEVLKKTKDADTLALLHDIDENALVEIVVKMAFREIEEIGDNYDPHFTRGINEHLKTEVVSLLDNSTSSDKFSTYSNRFSGNSLLLANTQLSNKNCHKYLISIQGHELDSLKIKVALTEMRSLGFYKNIVGTMTIIYNIKDKRFKIVMEQDDIELLENQLAIWKASTLTGEE